MIQLPPRITSKKPRRDNRIRSAAHLMFVRGHGCCVKGCSAADIQAAHVRAGTDGCLSRKPSDNWAISLCLFHHKRQHDVGEAAFERETGIDMKALAQEFWRRSPYRARIEAKMKRTA